MSVTCVCNEHTTYIYRIKRSGQYEMSVGTTLNWFYDIVKYHFCRHIILSFQLKSLILPKLSLLFCVICLHLP